MNAPAAVRLAHSRPAPFRSTRIAVIKPLIWSFNRNLPNDFFLVSNIRVDDNDQFGSHFTWRVAPAFLVPVTDTKLKASYGTGFKAPTLYELYGVGDFNFIGNPLLKPETSTGYEYGFEQPIANDRFRFGATYFHSDITDLINGVFVPANTYVNIGKALIHGYETFAEAKVTERLRVRGDYTQTVATDATTGAELQRRPRDKLSGNGGVVGERGANAFDERDLCRDVEGFRPGGQSTRARGCAAVTPSSISRPITSWTRTSRCSGASIICSTNNMRIRPDGCTRALASSAVTRTRAHQ